MAAQQTISAATIALNRSALTPKLVEVLTELGAFKACHGAPSETDRIAWEKCSRSAETGISTENLIAGHPKGSEAAN